MLSPEQFAEIIALIQTSQGDGHKSEIRRAPRIPHPCLLTLTLGNAQTPGPAFIVDMLDISHRGMSFAHGGELAIGTVFIVRLEATNGNSVSILSRIVHRKPLISPAKQFGAEFTQVIDRHELPRSEPTVEDFMLTRSHLLD